MSDFFKYFSDINQVRFPLVSFHITHIMMLVLSILYIIFMLRYYDKKTKQGKKDFQKKLGIYFFVEEMIYMSWVLINCKQNAIMEIVPLQLCTICVYMNILSLYLKKDTLRFFSGVVGTLAGLTAIVYPANISGLYSFLSYRSINFFILHATFIIFGILQLRDTNLLHYRYLKGNMLILTVLVFCAFTFNSIFHTDYMFLGSPPQIGFIKELYNIVGVVLFLPVVLLILYSIQYGALFCIRKIYNVKEV